MSRGWYYVPGDWNAICEVCGRKVKASALRQRWDGFMVCSRDWEPRHPQDFVKPKADKISVPWTSNPEDIDITVDYIEFEE